MLQPISRSGANLTGITLDSVTDIGSETSNSVAFGNIAFLQQILIV